MRQGQRHDLKWGMRSSETFQIESYIADGAEFTAAQSISVWEYADLVGGTWQGQCHELRWVHENK